MSTGQGAPQVAAVEKKPDTKITAAKEGKAHYWYYREGQYRLRLIVRHD